MTSKLKRPVVRGNVTTAHGLHGDGGTRRGTRPKNVHHLAARLYRIGHFRKDFVGEVRRTLCDHMTLHDRICDIAPGRRSEEEQPSRNGLDVHVVVCRMSDSFVVLRMNVCGVSSLWLAGTHQHTNPNLLIIFTRAELRI